MSAGTVKYTVRDEPFSRVRDEVIEALNETRDAVWPVERFDWLYAENPDGEATIWTIRADLSSELAGFTIALPRRMLVDGKLYRCWNCADFSIRRKYRSLGVAVKLRRAAKEGVDAGQADFLYAHPNARMQVIHERVGHTCIGRMVRYAKLLRSESWLAQRLPTRPLAKLAAAPVDIALWLRSPHWRRRFVTKTTLEKDVHFGEPFDALFERVSAHYRVIGVRDARYLNWRYKQNPLYRTHAALAYCDGRLVGYALFTVVRGVAHLKDLLYKGDAAIAIDLLTEFELYCRKQGVPRISLVALESNPLLVAAKQFGYSQRPETSMMFGHAPSGSRLRESVFDEKNWYSTVGDRDNGSM